MYINSQWRILTVGDGDLSFSSSLLQHHNPRHLTASVYDDYDTLANKYGDEYYQELKKRDCKVLTGFDITKPESWGELKPNSFDVVIFQFPLIPSFRSQEEFQEQCAAIGINAMNRQLLRTFLINAFKHYLDPQGAQLAFITSKDVKPYREWSIETSLTVGTDINYLGSMPFDIERFPGYKVRNVDRDKHVRETQGITYVWSLESSIADLQDSAELQGVVSMPYYLGEGYCSLCRTGPFASERDKLEHEQAKKHRTTLGYEQRWLDHIAVSEPV